MKPFAKVDKTPLKEHVVVIPGPFQIMVEGASKEYADRSCDALNRAHRASVRAELEAFREKSAVDTCCYCEMGDKPFRNENGDWLHRPNGNDTHECEALVIRSIDIDAFLDREDLNTKGESNVK